MMDEPVRLCLLVCLKMSFSTSDDLDNDDTVTDKTKFRYLLFFFTWPNHKRINWYSQLQEAHNLV